MKMNTLLPILNIIKRMNKLTSNESFILYRNLEELDENLLREIDDYIFENLCKSRTGNELMYKEVLAIISVIKED